MSYPIIQLTLPNWIDDFLAAQPTVFPTAEDKMGLAIALAQENVARATGGPFGAAIFDLETHRLLAPGVNRVVPNNCSLAHAEMMAIAVAQQLVGHFDLGGDAFPPYGLFTSTEPCAMCFGAVPWSGVRLLACGARDEDARAIGFDEGPKLDDWQRHLEARGIAVQRDVCRTAAARVLRDYMTGGGAIYNARQGDADDRADTAIQP